jgi:imidazolonepropionase-like amidohydrolase
MIWNLLRVALLVFLAGSVACSGVAANAQTLVLTGGSVYASPDAAALPDAVVVTSNGVISAVGRRGEVEIPKDAHVIDCS